MEMVYEVLIETWGFMKIIIILGMIIGIMAFIGEDNTTEETPVPCVQEKYPLAIQYLQESEAKAPIEPTIVNPEDIIPDKAVYQATASKYEPVEKQKVMPSRGVLDKDSQEELRRKLLAQLDGSSAPTEKKHNRAV